MVENHTMGQLIRSTVVFVGTAAALAACGGGGGGSSSPAPNPLYVRASSGNDGNSGADPAHALQTIGRAASLAGDGYTIIVGPGTYKESVQFTSTGASPKGVQFIANITGAEISTCGIGPVSGTGDAPGPVVIDATNTQGEAGFKFSNASASTTGAHCSSLIDGFEIVGASDGGIVLKTHSTQFVIQNCIVHGNSGDGIRVQDSANVLVFNSLIYNNGGTGVGIVGTAPDPADNQVASPNARVYNNTIYGNGNHGVTVGTTAAASPGAEVLNNIIQANDTPPAAFNVKVITGHPSPQNDSLSGYHGDCNLVRLPSYDPTSIRGSHDLGVDPEFVSATTDFHLQSGSPAIDHSDPNACALNLPNAQAPILRQRTTTGSNASGPGAPDSGNIDLGYHYPRH